MTTDTFQVSFSDNNEPEIIGVSLATDVEGQRSTNIGVCLVPQQQLLTLTVRQLREIIQRDVIACPANFVICTPQGWILTDSQEDQINVSQVLSLTKQVIIRSKQDGNKCGIKDFHGNVIGFVHINVFSKLQQLKQLICSEILDSDNSFHFLDGNNWPISSIQESHMTVADILFGSCVSTNISTQFKHVQFSPPKEPPYKRLKGAADLSFRSGKDIGRQLSTDTTDGGSSPKQVLISYVRSEAADNALKLKEQLTCLGISVYLDVHEIQTGVDWQDSLNFAVSSCEVFVPLVTLKYGETQWTNREVKLADVLGKYILPVSFLDDWPPRCLAIQFATTQFIPSAVQQQNSSQLLSWRSRNEWSAEDVRVVAEKIAERVKNIRLMAVPSLTKRTTIVKSCACVTEDNKMAIRSDREGKPLVMICIHFTLETYGEKLQSLLEGEGFEVWCTTELDKEHIEHIDALASSQGEITYSVLNKGSSMLDLSSSYGNGIMRNIEIFQEKADDASLVLIVLSEEFSRSRVCQQQVFYCEHRKRVIPILYEDFQMPDWMAMLVGSHGFEMRKDEDFVDILVRRVKSTIYQSKLKSSPAVSPVKASNRSKSLKPGTSSDETLKTRPKQTRPDDEGSVQTSLPKLSSSFDRSKHEDPKKQETSLTREESKHCVKHQDTDLFSPNEEMFQCSSTKVSDNKPSLTSMKTLIL